MSTDDLTLLFELFENTPRLGPGSAASTRRALRMLPADLRIERVLDLGCGTGASTLVLAEQTNAAITAVDIHPPFLATLRARAFLTSEYPDVRDEATRIEQARRLGYAPIGSFRLPSEDWRAYYAGLDAPLRAAIARHGALDVYEDLRAEMTTYEACGEEYGYVCLVLRVG